MCVCVCVCSSLVTAQQSNVVRHVVNDRNFHLYQLQFDLINGHSEKNGLNANLVMGHHEVSGERKKLSYTQRERERGERLWAKKYHVSRSSPND